MSRQPKALFIGGEPANLPAAALDALEWLELILSAQKRGKDLVMDKANQARLTRCVDTLKGSLAPHLPYRTRRRPLFEVAA